MRTARPILVLVLSASIGLLAACGSSTKSSSSTSTTASSGSSATKTVSLGSTSLGQVLVDSSGRTLYHDTKDTSTTIACTGNCAQTWPPLTIPMGTQPTWASGLTGSKFGTVSRPDGTLQVTYAGWPLYTYSNDTAAGQAQGQGVGGIWFAITAAGTNASSSAGSTTSSSSGGGYGY
jgi:predicted lipoprotein with Yx(FWY)xxD motif